MRRALEIFFRRQRHFLLLLVLLPLLSLAIGFFIPRPYQASASLWAAKRYDVTDATWVSEWYKMLGVENAVPAQAQADALTELLNSRAFALQVADATDLPQHVTAAIQQQRDDALFADISRNVKAEAVGNNLVTITYSNADAQLALQVVAATVQAFATTSQQLALQSGQELLATDQTQLAALQKGAAEAQANLQAYLNRNPGLRNDPNKQASDPTYQSLSGQVSIAQKDVTDLQGQIGQLQVQLTTIGSQPDALFSVQDAPVLVPSKTSRAQVLLLALAVGLAIALVVSGVYLALMMRADRAVYSAADVRLALAVPVLAEIPAVVFSPPVRAFFAIVDGGAHPTGDAAQSSAAALATHDSGRHTVAGGPSTDSR
jgi:uncharacterized protein involved in exopolysaccharide biosynthesis